MVGFLLQAQLTAHYALLVTTVLAQVYLLSCVAPVFFLEKVKRAVQDVQQGMRATLQFFLHR